MARSRCSLAWPDSRAGVRVHAQPRHGDGFARTVAERAVERRALGEQRLRAVRVGTGVEVDESGRGERPRPHRGGRGRKHGRPRQRPLQPVAPLAPVHADEPEAPQRADESERLLRPRRRGPLVQAPRERGAQVVVLGVEPLGPGAVLRPVQRRGGALRHRHEVGQVPVARRRRLARGEELLLGVLAQGLQQAVAGGAVRLLLHRDERLVHEPGQQVEHRVRADAVALRVGAHLPRPPPA